MKLLCKRLFDLFFLSRPKQPIVDEDTGQLVADGPMGKGRRHRRVYPATQGANDSLLADLPADLLHRCIHIRLHRPSRLAAANVVDEIAKQRRSFRRMNDFRMKLEAINPTLVIVALHRGNWRIGGMRDRSETRRHPLDTVSVRHPDDGRSLYTDALEQIAAVVNREISPAILPMLGFGYFSAREARHELHSVTNAEDGNALEYDALRTIREDRRQGHSAGQNL